mmetsp:Transcript_7074/g.7785  ORF Transcript_7074/g.7785 Transcript_7074/m.7785 type:complete len:289 (-) Transcript_7074:156-1022(-)
MGNDGGSIPRRIEMVKEKPKEYKTENSALARKRATLCTMTNQRLAKHIAVCKLGNLYNKEAVVGHLLKKTMPKEFQYIRKLKDVKDVSLTESDKPGISHIFLCPVSGVELNGYNRFYANWNCGCVLSEKAINEIKVEDRCLSCNEEYSKGDLIDLNMTLEQKERLIVEMRLSTKTKKDKKKSKLESSKSVKAEDEEEKTSGNPKKRRANKDSLEMTKAILENGGNVLVKHQKQTEESRNIHEARTKQEDKLKEGKSDIYRSLIHDPSKQKNATADERFLAKSHHHGVR